MNFIEPVLSDKNGKFSFYFFQNLAVNTIFAYKKGLGQDFVSGESIAPFTGRVPQKPEQENGPFALVLSKAEPVKIHVEDNKGNPLEGVSIRPGILNKKNGDKLLDYRGSLGDIGRFSEAQDDFFKSVTDKDGNAVIDWLPKNLVVSNTNPEDVQGKIPVKTSFSVSCRYSGNYDRFFSHKSVDWEPGRKEYSVKLDSLIPISGTILDHQGKPCFPADIQFLHPNPNLPNGFGQGYTVETRPTNRAGEYFYLIAPDNRLKIVVESMQGAIRPIDLEFGSIEDNPSKKLNLVLDKGGKIFGKVVEKRAGKTLGDSSFQLTFYSGVKRLNGRISEYDLYVHGKIEKNGTYEAVLLPGKYTVHLSVYDHGADAPRGKAIDIEQEIEIAAGEKLELDLIIE